MTKAFVVFGTSETSGDPFEGQVSGQLTGPTALTFQRVAGTGSITLKYYVAEFSSGVSVQRGSVDNSGGNVFNVTLVTADNTAKSFPLISYRTEGTFFNCNDFVQAKITSTTNLRLSTDSVTCGTVAISVVEWQVVQYQDANVQSGDVTFAAGALSQTAALAPAVNTARSWLIYSYQGTPDAAPDNGQYLVRGLLTDSTTLTFDRNNAGTVAINLTWYLVEFTDGTTVQHASEPFTTVQTQRDVTLGAAVDLGHSIATAGGDYQRGGRSNYAADDVPGVGWFTLDLTSPTNLRITRGTTPGHRSAPGGGHPPQ